MLVSLLVGTGVYMLAQFVWYAPFGFGPLWSRYRKATPVSGESPLALPGFVTPSVRGILLPALIISLALHVFRIMTPRLGSASFLFGVLVLWCLVVAGKHLLKSIGEAERRRWFIEDGALLWSLLWVAEVVIIWWGSV